MKHEDILKVTRLEVVDDSGRAYVNTSVRPGSIWWDIQDQGRTLKIFTEGMQAGCTNVRRPDDRELSEAILLVGEALTKKPVQLKDLVKASAVLRDIRTQVAEEASRNLLDALTKMINKTAMTMFAQG